MATLFIFVDTAHMARTVHNEADINFLVSSRTHVMKNQRNAGTSNHGNQSATYCWPKMK